CVLKPERPDPEPSPLRTPPARPFGRIERAEPAKVKSREHRHPDRSAPAPIDEWFLKDKSVQNPRALRSPLQSRNSGVVRARRSAVTSYFGGPRYELPAKGPFRTVSAARTAPVRLRMDRGLARDIGRARWPRHGADPAQPAAHHRPAAVRRPPKRALPAVSLRWSDCRFLPPRPEPDPSPGQGAGRRRHGCDARSHHDG